jgi:hypothetical protein
MAAMGRTLGFVKPWTGFWLLDRGVPVSEGASPMHFRFCARQKFR